MDLIGNLGNCHWLFEEGVYLVLQFWVSSSQRKLQTYRMANLTNHVNTWNWTLLSINS